MNAPIEWSLAGEPWIEYRTRLDLPGQFENDPNVKAALKSVSADSHIRNLIRELSGWPRTVISSHKSASRPFHKLTFVDDLGIKADDPKMDKIIARILKHPSPEGPFQLPTNIPTHFGGTGQDRWAWALCDAPLVVYSLAKFSPTEETR